MQSETPYSSTLPGPTTQPAADPSTGVADVASFAAAAANAPPANRGCARLQEAITTNETSINVGGSVLGMLGNQRETLLTARGTLEASAGNASSSLSLVRQMIRREQSKKWMMRGSIIFLCARPPASRMSRPTRFFVRGRPAHDVIARTSFHPSRIVSTRPDPHASPGALATLPQPRRPRTAAWRRFWASSSPSSRVTSTGDTLKHVFPDPGGEWVCSAPHAPSVHAEDARGHHDSPATSMEQRHGAE